MIDFPASPVAGQIFFASNGAVYQYNSTYTSWVQIASSVLNDATFYVEGAGALFAPSVVSTWETANPGTVRIGNVGGWYNTSTGVFTPPAGRYLLIASCSFMSSSSSMQGQLRWRKNGAVILTNFDTVVHTPGTSLWGTVQNQIIVDANGTDTFDLQVQSTVLMSQAWGYIGAYPLSQQSLAGGSSWRQIARTVVGAPQATLNFQNIPSDINDIEVRFDLTPVSNDVDLYVQLYDGSNTLLTGANYNWSQTMTSHAQAIASAPAVAGSVGVGVNTTFILDYSVATRRISASAPAAGKFEINNIRAVQQKYLRSEIDYLSGDNTLILDVKGGGRYAGSVAVTGCRLLFSGGNIAAGSVASLWGSP